MKRFGRIIGTPLSQFSTHVVKTEINCAKNEEFSKCLAITNLGIY